MKVQQFVDEGLGNATHLMIAERSGVAALIDPLRDVDRYLDAATSMGARITHVFETRICSSRCPSGDRSRHVRDSTRAAFRGGVATIRSIRGWRRSRRLSG